MLDLRANQARVWRAIRHGVLIALVLGVSIGLFVLWERGSRRPAATGAAPGPAAPALAVSVIQVVRQAVPLSPTYLGRTEASQTVEIRARVNGFLDERAFEEGAPVSAGQLLFKIDPRPLEAALAVATARNASAQARLDEAQRQIRRLDQAAAGGATSQLEFDQARTDERVAAADLRLAEATVVQAQLDLGYTQVKSPIAGIIGRSLKDAGSYVEAGAQGLLATVQQLDPIYVTFSVSEREILRWQHLLAEGQVSIPQTDRIPLVLKLADGSTYSRPAPGGGREPVEGHINFISAQVDATTGTALARGVFENTESLLKPGQFVRVTSRGISRLGAVLVPQRAVLLSPAGASVYIVVEDQGQPKAVSRAVTVEDWYGDNWIVTDGLESGDRVIVDRAMQVRPGAVVTPTIIPGPTVGPSPVSPG
ncbi:MAG: efflux RND transporter periplasmic adaptor subunit [Phycisphaerales bacterium]|nr:efflux RND transporter periplasmic adaptor subunit [Phycisphaerales bacterium]